MASYKYQQNDFDGAGAGYVRYNISPDLGSPLAPGETVTVTGQAFYRSCAHACIELAMKVSGRTFFARVNQGFPKGQSTAFTLSYTVPPEMAAVIREGRTARAAMEFTLWRGKDAGGTGDSLIPATEQALLLLKYRLAPAVEEARFVRCRETEDGWEASDEGMCALAEALRVRIAPEAAAADLSVHRLEYADAAGETHTVELDPAALLAGYGESVPALLADARFLLGRDYRLTLVAGDEWDTARAVVMLPRAYTNFHQSGAARGGAAFGMFSGSTDSAALLESAYPIHGYAGLYGADGARLDGAVEQRIAAFGSQFAAYSEAQAPRVLRAGRLVQLSGSCTPLATIAAGTEEQLLFTLPRRFWPLAPVAQLCQGSGTSFWLLRVSTGGLVTLSRYRKGTDYLAAEPGNWLPLQAAWIASDYDGPARVRRPARAMRSNSHQGCRAAASSVSGAATPAWRAFDFRETTGWMSLASDQDPWLQLKLDTALKNITVRVYARDADTADNPTAGRILGSSDGSAWTELGAFSGWSVGQSGGLLGEVPCRHETAYTWVRLAIDARSRARAGVAVGYMTVEGELPEE